MPCHKIALVASSLPSYVILIAYALLRRPILTCRSAGVGKSNRSVWLVGFGWMKTDNDNSYSYQVRLTLHDTLMGLYDPRIQNADVSLPATPHICKWFFLMVAHLCG